MINVIIFIVVAFGSLYLGYFLRRYYAEKKTQDAETKARFIVEQAKKEAEDRKRGAELEGKDLLYKLRQDFEQQTKDRSHPGQEHWEAGKVKTDSAGNAWTNS